MSCVTALVRLVSSLADLFSTVLDCLHLCVCVCDSSLVAVLPPVLKFPRILKFFPVLKYSGKMYLLKILELHNKRQKRVTGVLISWHRFSLENGNSDLGSLVGESSQRNMQRYILHVYFGVVC